MTIRKLPPFGPSSHHAQAVPPQPAKGATDDDIYHYALRLEGTEEWTIIEANKYQKAVIEFARGLGDWDGEKVVVELKYYLEAFSISLYEIQRDADGTIRGVGAGRVTFSSQERPSGGY